MCAAAQAWFLRKELGIHWPGSLHSQSTVLEAWIGKEEDRALLEHYYCVVGEVKELFERKHFDDKYDVETLLKELEFAKAKKGGTALCLEGFSEKDREEKNHFASVVVGSRWTSRKGNKYVDYYFPYCGLFSHTIVDGEEGGLVQESECLLWGRPDKERRIHHGRLSEIGGSRKYGGGQPGDHLARGRTPVWSCCGEKATELGCGK